MAGAGERDGEEEEEEIVCLEASFFINDKYTSLSLSFFHYLPPCLLKSITGILCSRFCREVVLTDHNDEVQKILKKNIELHSSKDHSHHAELVAEKLEWGNSDQINQILRRRPGGFDLILGADIYILGSVPLLFDTVKQLLQVRERDCCKFILAYVSRAKIMDSLVVSEAIRHGMQINEIPGTRSVVGNLEGVIFEVTLLEKSPM
ncbi:hypothetical protein CRG98_021854 [Punica granatum]|uniref:Protein N-lysine methyltransferase METTL21A n=1 Tax=Punica granatum TaxID=22663 RepID=A0A2I0JNB9_PUNGR|nr:hypothetical protein CRG98_021854 [Punica granatum]